MTHLFFHRLLAKSIIPVFVTSDSKVPDKQLRSIHLLADVVLKSCDDVIPYLDRHRGAIILDPCNHLSLRKDDGEVTLIGKQQSFLQGLTFKNTIATYDGQTGCSNKYKNALDHLSLSAEKPYLLCSLKPELLDKHLSIRRTITKELVNELVDIDEDEEETIDCALLDRLTAIDEEKLEKLASDSAIHHVPKQRSRKTISTLADNFTVDADILEEIMHTMAEAGVTITEKEAEKACFFFKRHSKENVRTNLGSMDGQPEAFENKLKLSSLVIK